MTLQQFTDSLDSEQMEAFNEYAIGIRQQLQAAYAESIASVSVAKDHLLVDKTAELETEQASHHETRLLAETLNKRIAELTTEVDRLTQLVPIPPGPREITPEQFMKRFSPSDLIAIDQSKDPRVILAKVTLQTRESVIELDSPLLGQMIDGLIAAGIPIDEKERAAIFASNGGNV
jgi:hypothetical protein